MTMMTVTDSGLAAIANAEKGGFLLNVTRLAVTQYVPVDAAAADLYRKDTAAVAVEGVEVFSASPETIEAISSNVVKFTFNVPIGIPTVGKWVLSEVAAYLEDGTLFARGLASPPQDKEAHYGVRLFIMIGAARLGDVINISLSANSNVPSSAHVRDVPFASAYPWNVVSVLDQMENPDRTSSGGLAVRYGAGARQWGFLGYDRVYCGTVDVVDPSTFTVDIMEAGFYAKKKEILIASVTNGDSYGDSRKVRYLGENIFRELDGKPFTKLTVNSQVSIWRSSSANRVGTLFTPTISAGEDAKILGNGGKVYPINFSVKSKDYIMAFLNGETFYDDFTIMDGNLFVTGDDIPQGNYLQLYVFGQDSGNVNETGTIIRPKHKTFIADGLESYFDTGVGIENIFHTIVSIGGVRQEFNAYEIQDDSAAALKIAPHRGQVVSITVFERHPQKNCNFIMRRTVKRTSTDTIELYKPASLKRVQNPCVFLSELHCTNFVVSGRSINLRNEGDDPASVTVTPNAEVVIVEFSPLSALPNEELSPIYSVEVNDSMTGLTLNRIDGSSDELSLVELIKSIN